MPLAPRVQKAIEASNEVAVTIPAKFAFPVPLTEPPTPASPNWTPVLATTPIESTLVTSS